jgi:hypothetical protein
MVVEQFRRYKPPTFNGREGPLAAEEWLRALERIFKHIACSDTQKVSCAVFQLAEDADHWWESYQRTRTEAQQLELTWEGFKELILQRYFPQSFRDQKETEFLELKQGSMSVVEYETKFNQLSRYAIHLVDTDIKKARRFERGLRPEIGGIMAGLGLTTYAEAIERAQAISSRLNLEKTTQKPTEAPVKRKWDS